MDIDKTKGNMEIDISKLLGSRKFQDDNDSKYGEFRKIIISGDIDNESAREIVDAINLINFYDDKQEKEQGKKSKYVREPIEIQINSSGGVIYDGFAIIAAMDTSKTPVNTVAYGQAMSMGLLILLCGKKRAIHKYAIIMYHELSGGHGHSDKLEMQKREIAESIRIQKLLDKIVLQRTKLKQAKLDEIKKVAADFYITAKQAKDFGIVHEIL
jgi:ATP-dependent Clp protease protease subunit